MTNCAGLSVSELTFQIKTETEIKYKVPSLLSSATNCDVKLGTKPKTQLPTGSRQSGRSHL